MTFADKSAYDRTFQQVTHKGGGYAINYIKRFQNAHALSFLVGMVKDQTLFRQSAHFVDLIITLQKNVSKV